MEELEDEADRVAADEAELVLVEAGHVAPDELVAPAVGPVEAAEDVEEGGLARARGAHDREVLAGRDLLADVDEGVDGLAADVEGAGEALEADHSRAFAPALISGRSSEHHHALALVEAARDLGEVPVPQPQLERPLDQPPALEDEDLPALEQRRRGHAQDAVLPAQDDLGVGRGAGQERGGDRVVLELELDLDRAVLLQAVHHVGGHLHDARGEAGGRGASPR